MWVSSQLHTNCMRTQQRCADDDCCGGKHWQDLVYWCMGILIYTVMAGLTVLQSNYTCQLNEIDTCPTRKRFFGVYRKRPRLLSHPVLGRLLDHCKHLTSPQCRLLLTSLRPIVPESHVSSSTFLLCLLITSPVPRNSGSKTEA